MEVIATGSRPSVTAADGSSVRELAHPDWAAARALSVAEAKMQAGSETLMHRHLRSEEIYLVQAGSGRMLLAGEERAVEAGDCIVIAPGAPHKLINEGPGPLVVLCCCAPAYSEDDTELVEHRGRGSRLSTTVTPATGAAQRSTSRLRPGPAGPRPCSD